MKPRALVLTLVLLAIAGSIYYLESIKPAHVAPQGGSNILTPPPGAFGADPRADIKAEKAKRFPSARELAGISGYINVDTITIAENIGKKVILVDFWTYSCINCQRTLPYIEAWWEKYKDQGLLVIGVHTPEFEFEKVRENVLAATRKFNVTYPVVQDNDYATWQAYGNRYWPRKYLIDIDGFIVYDHIGEGAYVEAERIIQELLGERMTALNVSLNMTHGMVTPVALPPPSFPVSPETYFGAARNTLLANGVQHQRGLQHFELPSQYGISELYLDGDWFIDDEFAENTAVGARIVYRYDAKDVYLVASAAAGHPNGVRVRVVRDGQAIGDWAGDDTVREGNSTILTVKDSTLYKVVQDKGGYGNHVLELIPESPGLQAFTFTFG